MESRVAWQTGVRVWVCVCVCVTRVTTGQRLLYKTIPNFSGEGREEATLGLSGIYAVNEFQTRVRPWVGKFLYNGSQVVLGSRGFTMGLGEEPRIGPPRGAVVTLDRHGELSTVPRVARTWVK